MMHMNPFEFKSRLNLVELLGVRARNIQDLRQGLSVVPGSSIYHHTHRFLQQHNYLYPEPPNDFAFWIGNALAMDDLAERLAAIDTIGFHRIEEIRECLLLTLDHWGERGNAHSRICNEGEEFHFMSSRTFVLPTPLQASNLEEFSECLRKISVNSIYYHIFEARLRLEQDENDFSLWFAGNGFAELAGKIRRLDPYTITMEGLRKKILKLIAAYA
jgi:hypothetical protein